MWQDAILFSIFVWCVEVLFVIYTVNKTGFVVELRNFFCECDASSARCIAYITSLQFMINCPKNWKMEEQVQRALGAFWSIAWGSWHISVILLSDKIWNGTWNRRGCLDGFRLSEAVRPSIVWTATAAVGLRLIAHYLSPRGGTTKREQAGMPNPGMPNPYGRNAEWCKCLSRTEMPHPGMPNWQARNAEFS